MKAKPVDPSPQPKEIRRAEPVRPSDTIPDDQLIKPSPPPASDFGD
jgi:hypothetical protein